MPYERIYPQKRRIEKIKKVHQEAKRSNAHVAYKINAVILLGTGWTLNQVRQALLLDGETLRSYVKKYRENGIEGLIRTHYNGCPSELTELQKNQLREELEKTIHLSTSSIIDYSCANLWPDLHGQWYEGFITSFRL